MNAQEIIDQSKCTDWKKVFYPELWKKEQAELNLIKCIRKIKSKKVKNEKTIC